MLQWAAAALDTLRRPDRTAMTYPHLPASPPSVTAERTALARLVLAQRGGRTRMVTAEHRAPLRLLRALYPEDAAPDLAWVILANPSGGVLAGDRYRIEVTALPEARAAVLTQAATKVHPALPAAAPAVQSVVLTVHPSALLEYLPDPLIPFADADYEQETRCVAYPGGTLFLWDMLAPGKAARGERHQYRHIRSRLLAVTPEGRPLCAEAYTLTPNGAPPALLGGHDAFGTLWAITDRAPAAALLAAVRPAIEGSPAVVAATALPNQAGVAVKALGRDTAAVEAALLAARGALRLALFGLPLPDPRRY
ncbi:MAG: urease accessory protein UreD [Chloroflexi bacterium]|nr:urease accessory protein UreD [Chloroflexota bacterium]